MNNTEEQLLKEFLFKFHGLSLPTRTKEQTRKQLEQFLLSSIREAEQRGREEERRRIIEEIKQWTGGGRQSDGYEQAIDDVIFSLSSTDDVSSKEENHIDDANKMVVNKEESGKDMNVPSKPMQKEDNLCKCSEGNDCFKGCTGLKDCIHCKK